MKMIYNKDDEFLSRIKLELKKSRGVNLDSEMLKSIQIKRISDEFKREWGYDMTCV